MTDQRIKLAEFVGWKRGTIGTEYCWRHEDGRLMCKLLMGEKGEEFFTYFGMCPDPRNDANDCEALIRKLNEHGWSVVVDWQHDDPKHAPGVWIEFWHFETEIHERIQGMDRERWKAGVCDLAEKVIDAAENGRIEM